MGLSDGLPASINRVATIKVNMKKSEIVKSIPNNKTHICS
jgi:hypothetical protein